MPAGPRENIDSRILLAASFIQGIRIRWVALARTIVGGIIGAVFFGITSIPTGLARAAGRFLAFVGDTIVGLVRGIFGPPAASITASAFETAGELTGTGPAGFVLGIGISAVTIIVFVMGVSRLG